MGDTYNLKRFVDAQDHVYEGVLRELYLGVKTGHWMWYIFPQIVGLGHSSLSKKYSISCLQEAKEYLDHPVLGRRLKECTKLVNRIEGRTIKEIFGHPDHLKFHSSMTLFAHATKDSTAFKDALIKYFDDNYDTLTIKRL